MALGLSVIFGVTRIVNFAHGEMMTIAMYAAVMALARLNVPLCPQRLIILFAVSRRCAWLIVAIKLPRSPGG
jgi:branched-subunit amino acid ABC-type transport system permease component